MDVRRKVRTARAVWAPSLARRVLRHRGLWAVTAVSLALAGSLSLTSQVAAIGEEREQWGTTTTVFVVTGEVNVGQVVDDLVEERVVPEALIGETAVRSIEPGSRAKERLFPGEILLSDRITQTRARGLPVGSVAITLSVIAHVPLVELGDLIDLYIIDSANLSSRRVAERVVVLALDDSTITVAVPESMVAEATVASLRPVTVVLVG